jgi:alkylation response protein AidB-like acyl-CoA dehydrogenase
MMLVGDAFGRGLVREPFLAGTVMAGTALKIAPPSAARAEAIAALGSGEKRFALVEDPALVLGGDVADMLVVREGHQLALVDAHSVGRRAFVLHNGWGAAAVDLTGGKAIGLGGVSDASEAIAQAAIAWVAANGVGTMSAALDLTVEFLRTREQFGKPIGTNQALQHRVAEMLVELEAARSMAIFASQMIDDPDPSDRRRAFAAIKLVVNKAMRLVGQQVVQLHGGIGVCEEHDAGRFFKHLCVLELLFGDCDEHARVLAEAGGFTAATPLWEQAAQ